MNELLRRRERAEIAERVTRFTETGKFPGDSDDSGSDSEGSQEAATTGPATARSDGEAIKQGGKQARPASAPTRRRPRGLHVSTAGSFRVSGADLVAQPSDREGDVSVSVALHHELCARCVQPLTSPT